MDPSFSDSEDEEAFSAEDDLDEIEQQEQEESEVVHGGEAKAKTAVYNSLALHEKLEEISWTDSHDWIHSLSYTHSDDAVEKVDVHDDLAREMAFYTQALEGSKEALERLQEAGVRTVRPSDFYAEMVKSDTHMLKVKERLIQEQRMMEEAEERRKQRDSKKFSKEVQAEKTKERAKQKKEEIQSVQKWRKMRQKSDFAGDGGDFPLDLEGGKKRPKDPLTGDRTSFKARGGGFANKKRETKQTKYGFGGRKRLGKQNTADSAGDMDGFSAGRRKPDFAGGRGGGRGGERGGRGGGRGRGGGIRPGKARRQTARGKSL